MTGKAVVSESLYEFTCMFQGPLCVLEKLSNPAGMQHIQINCKLALLTNRQFQPTLVNSDYVKTAGVWPARAHGSGME